MNQDIQEYNNNLADLDKQICDLLASEIYKNLPTTTSKIWHGSPVWFLDENPIVGYSKQKKGIKLLFWSGESFEEEKLENGSGEFKDAGVFYNSVEEINLDDLKSWCQKS